jgi:hypothetical protein
MGAGYPPGGKPPADTRALRKFCKGFDRFVTPITRRKAPSRLNRLQSLPGTAVLIVSVTLVAWSALELRPPIPAATSSRPFEAILATVIISVI